MENLLDLLGLAFFDAMPAYNSFSVCVKHFPTIH